MVQLKIVILFLSFVMGNQQNCLIMAVYISHLCDSSFEYSQHTLASGEKQEN